MIIEVMSAAAAIDRDKISNLIVNTETPYEFNLSIATNKEIPILNKILNKGLSQITENEKKAIKLKWLPFENKRIIDNKYFWLVLFLVIASLIIIISIMLWNYSLKEAVENKTKELKKSKLELEKQNSRLEKATKMLKESEKRFEALSKYSTDIISRYSSDLKHLYVNPAIRKITKLGPDEFIGKTFSELGFPENLVKKWKSAIKTVFETELPYESEFKINNYYFHWSLMPEFSHHGKDGDTYVSAVITSARDITQMKKTEKEIEYKSYHDELKGLNNRAYFNENLNAYSKNSNFPLGIILADLNTLKITNDTFGHIEGDRLLKKVADIFKASCEYKALISRIGGD